ncbi:MAG: ribbon-helix-helix protein, CopG family [Ruminococcus sp.]|nr:ribbon-helix-helix protein, CopG family [Ruminococcus sp.]
MDKLIIESRTILDDSTHIRVSKKSKELIDEIAKRSGRSQAVVADRMIAFAYERVVIEGEEDDE